jgi:1,4-alpha-glucan branching enzyme
MNESNPFLPQFVRDDPFLLPYWEEILQRKERYDADCRLYETTGGLKGQISLGHRYFGFNRDRQDNQSGIWFREWAPGATGLYLIGDFNQWDRSRHPLHRDEFGVWSVFLPDDDTENQLTHGSLVKIHVVTSDGSSDRIPAYIRRVIYDQDSKQFIGQYWSPPVSYRFENPRPTIQGGLRIYEAHVGMAQEKWSIGTFDEFRENILPRIAALGYDAIQLMAIQEHPYYASFGYHVSNFFAVSSRFGTPEDLKRLIDAAHGHGLLTFLDLVHSHAVKNTLEGLNRFDGTDHQYFHAGMRGEHPAWDSMVFDYSRYEVRRFLASNVRFWLEEYHFDGFRFDGVTSMLYLDHGLEREFAGYEDYFGANVDEDAIAYLKLANDVAHAVHPHSVCIAEDVSGMPGLARPTSEGGIGFDYRLAMGAPDYWIKLVKETPEEQWRLGDMYQTLLNRRRNEKHIGYAESHDQSLVGDQTLAFRLMGSNMYEHMAISSSDLIIDRGIALHKLIRLLTFALAGEGWLNFIGNEFGHPEWVDFPREGNGDSFQYARRQWGLVDSPLLRYQDLNRFDAAMMHLDADFNFLNDPLIEQLALHEDTRQLVFRRGPLVFAFNFHPSEAYPSLRIPVPDFTDYRVALTTDASLFSGWGRALPDAQFPIQPIPMYGRAQSLQIYLPNRSALVLAPQKQSGKENKQPFSNL